MVFPGFSNCCHCDFCISSVQLLSCIWLFATPWTAAHQASLSITNSWSLPKPMSIELVMPSNHLIVASNCGINLQFSHSVVSDSLWSHGLQHASLPCLSPTPGVGAQTHVHWVGDAIQPFHPLSSPSPPAFNFSQHQGLFQWVSSLHQMTKVLELQLQHQSFQWTPRTDLL